MMTTGRRMMMLLIVACTSAIYGKVQGHAVSSGEWIVSSPLSKGRESPNKRSCGSV